MSAFICQECDQLKDADDGCIEGDEHRLICADCMIELELDPE